MAVNALEIPELRSLKPSEHRRVFEDFFSLRQGIQPRNAHPVSQEMAQKTGPEYSIISLERAFYSARSMSSGDLPDIIAHTIRQLPAPKFIPLHRRFCKLDPVNDFKLTEYVTGIDDIQVQEIKELEPVQCYPVTMQNVSAQVKHYRTRLSVSRQLFINNSEWLKSSVNAIELAMYRKEAALVYAALEAGAPGHTESGVITADIGNLSLAFEKFRDLKTSTGELLGAEPRYFIVPASAERTARVYLRECALENKVEVIARSGLIAAYLLPDPAEFATIIIQTFGSEDGKPIVMTAPAKPGSDNVVTLDGYHDCNPFFVSGLATVKLAA